MKFNRLQYVTVYCKLIKSNKSDVGINPCFTIYIWFQLQHPLATFFVAGVKILTGGCIDLLQRAK